MHFVYINHNVLDNLFYIIVSILMFFVLYDNVSRLKKYKQILLTACMSLPIILCMKFPIYIDQYCVHDLRQIPLFIGTLYGGWPTGAALLIILLVSRFAIYGFNFLTLIVYVVIFIATAFFSTKFNRVNKKKKLIFSAAITLFLEIITTYMAVEMSDFFIVTEAYIFYFIILPPVIVFFAVYLLEILMDTIHVRSNMVKLEKMEVVSQLAASISHEVRNPLTVVKGFIELLKDPNLSQDKKEQYIEHVSRELNNAETIISDYLAFAKPATEKIEPIFVEREFKNIIEILKPWANMNSVKLKDQLVPGSVLGNANYFRQCFLNIIKNGVEAMPNGGELEIATFLNKNDLTIKVSDTGVGMTKEQINRFGEPYYSSKEKGTGLGSMVAVKTIQMMKGKLEIESVPNEGTTITVIFPIYLAEKAKVKENPLKLETEFLRS
ncbi:HAMP domain-containing histidine kinase [Neobacillus cucumis]|uniref:sensor histidine kinase n=1 Tax=Neobacillus cucumis TaxID=1740721 RepID=UPI0018DF3AF5|nr:HAMP domain-containing sensor histidine kinase [Neobacillus cucumis]MBI0579202.1 HAMP domain-containing histidine kinase [Neobacillus cucumis]